MADNIRRLLRLYGFYARMDAQWLMQDTALCLICILSETVCSLTSVTAVFLLAVQFDGVGAMTADEVLLMLGLYVLSTGLYNMLLSGNNTGDISRRIGRGQLDHCLIQPLPLWMQFLTEGFLPVSGCQGALCGVAVVIMAVRRLNLVTSPLWWLTAAGCALLSLMVQAGLRYLVSLPAFTHPMGSEEISSVAGEVLSELGRYPLGGLSPLAQGLLCTVLPAGCLAYLPAMLLLGRLPAGAGWLYPLVAVCICGAGILSFRKGLTLYARYGSSRYKSMGHRS